MSINNHVKAKLLAKLSKKIKTVFDSNSAILTLWHRLLTYSATAVSSKFLQLLAKLLKKSRRKKFLRRWLKHMQEYNEQQHRQQAVQRQRILTEKLPAAMTPQFRSSQVSLRNLHGDQSLSTKKALLVYSGFKQISKARKNYN